MNLSGADALVGQLLREGVKHIFGVPGQQLDYATDALAPVTDRIGFFSTRHEQGAAYMADGYARASGEVGVAMVVPGPGLLNACAALATAYACSSPVLCIAGQIPSSLIGRGVGVLHEIPGQSTVLDSVTKWHALARAPGDIPGLVREAFIQLRSGRPRPVALEIPPDVLSAKGEATLIDPPTGEDRRTRPEIGSVEEAARLLMAAKRPVIFVGSGIHAAGASEALRVVAEALQAPVIMTRSGLGALSARHSLALSRLGGRKLLPDADVVLVVGSRFVGFQAKGVVVASGAKVIMVDVDPGSMAEPRTPDLPILGDAGLFLVELARFLGSPSAAGGEWSGRAATARAWSAEQLAPIEPQMSYLRAIRAAMPDDAILATDLTQVAYPARVGFPFYQPRTNLTAGYQGTLGFAYPSALGAKVACPDRVVISLSGDGGFAWTMQELATARQYDIGVIALVFNDNAYSNVRRAQKDLFEGRTIGATLRNPDFMTLARAFDIAGMRAGSPAELETAIRTAAAAGGPALIEIPIGEVPSPWHLLG